MAFVPNARHDVFVSYAHVDDAVLPGLDIDNGWVTTLIESLMYRLDQMIGRDAYSLSRIVCVSSAVNGAFPASS